MDGKNCCLRENVVVHGSGHKQSVSGNMRKSMGFESTPLLQLPLLGFHSGSPSYALDKIFDLSKQERNSHFPVDNISMLQQQAISDVMGCGCQQPSSSSNFRIQCPPVKPQITANIGHCQFPSGQQHLKVGFKSVVIGAMNRMCGVPLNRKGPSETVC